MSRSATDPAATSTARKDSVDTLFTVRMRLHAHSKILSTCSAAEAVSKVLREGRPGRRGHSGLSRRTRGLAAAEHSHIVGESQDVGKWRSARAFWRRMASFWGLPTSKDTSEGRWLQCGRATFAGCSAIHYGRFECLFRFLRCSLLLVKPDASSLGPCVPLK